MKRKESGQALVIILLVMAVGLTIALSIVSRSVTDIRISREQEESARAFSAAEAGIEEALRVDLGVGSAISEAIGGVDYRVSAVGQGGGTEFAFEEAIAQGDTQTVWLVGHNSAGNPDPNVDPYMGSQIRLFFGNDGTGGGTGDCNDSPAPALEAMVIYEEGGVYKARRYTIDPDDGRRNDCNYFDFDAAIVDAEFEGKKFEYRRIITLPTVGSNYALRLRLLYNDVSHTLGVRAVGSGVDLPLQGKCYESTATVLESDITRKVRQCQSYPVPPAIFDYVLFSGGDLTK